MAEVKIALLGAGTIGSGVYRLIHKNMESIAEAHGVAIKIKYALVRDINKPRKNVPQAVLTDDFSVILNDTEIQLVVEAMGGTEPALQYALSCLEAGKTYVTANKELIAKHWDKLEKAAAKTSAGLYFEASVAGGIPIIKSITDGLQANNIKSIMGIINGTTNYVLSKMSEENWEYKQALKKAQTMGYAEPDPTNDVEGFDAVYKLAILASLAFRQRVCVNDVSREGITKVTKQDTIYAEELGYVIKLLAIGKRSEKGLQLQVHPTMIGKEHPLASVSGPFNAIFINGSAVGELMLYGRGAGDMPTASAIVSDIINALTEKTHMRYPFIIEPNGAKKILDDWQSAFYIRFTVMDKPGVLSKISGLFAKYNVSLESVVQKGKQQKNVALVIITHRASEKAFMHAIEEINKLDFVKGANIIRVE